MVFGFPMFLWFLPLAGLPVLFHLMMKRRERRLEFPSLMFFIKADPRMHARRRLRELLLLAVRIMLLAMLILALSRPSLPGVPGVAGNLALAVVLDNSASMDGPAAQADSKLEFAREAARRLVDAMGEGSMAAVVPLVPDPVAGVSSELTGDRDRLKDYIDRVRRTEARATPGDAFSRIRSALARVPDNMGRAVHVFTDLHESGWDHSPLSADAFWEHTDVVFHRIETKLRTGANVSIESIDAPDRILLPGHSYEVRVALLNNSDADADVRVNQEDSQGGTASARVAIGAGGSELLQYQFTPAEAGNHWIKVWLEGDSFRGDNRAGIGLVCRPEALVYFTGERRSYGMLPVAVSPTGTGRCTSLRPVYRDPAVLMEYGEEGPPAMVVSTWNGLSALPQEQSASLEDYVRRGGRLLVVPDLTAYRQQRQAPPGWLGAFPGPYQVPAEPEVARILDRESGIWHGLHREDGSIGMRFFFIERYSELELDAAYEPIAGLSRRSPILAVRSIGEGRVYASGIAFDRRWTALATDPSGTMVVMLHNIVTRGVSATDGLQHVSVVAGEHIPAAAGPGLPVEVTAFIGDTVNVTFPPGQSLILPRAGAYRVSAGDRVYNVSVRGAPEEASNRYIEGDSIAFMGRIGHKATTLSADRDFARQLSAHFAGLSLFLPLAVLAVLLWACEAWLATGHRKRSRTIVHGGAAGQRPDPVRAPGPQGRTA